MRRRGIWSGASPTGNTRRSLRTETASMSSVTRGSTRSGRRAHADDEDARPRPEVTRQVETRQLQPVAAAPCGAPLQLGDAKLRMSDDTALPVHEQHGVRRLAQAIDESNALSNPHAVRKGDESRRGRDGVEHDRLRQSERAVGTSEMNVDTVEPVRSSGP